MGKYNKKDFLILYANCIPVKGTVRSLLCDLQNGKYYFIPNDLYCILKEEKKVTLGKLYDIYGKENREVIEEYISFVINNKLGFIDDEIHLFPEMNLRWESPSLVTNAIIDISKKNGNNINYESIIKELDSFNCSCIQFRCFDIIEMNFIESLLNLTVDSRINDIRFVLKFNQEIETLFKERLIKKHKRITEIIFFNHKENSTKKEMGVDFTLMSKKVLSNADCGNVCQQMFVTNIYQFTEAQKFNTCLNKKISIDVNGDIKNCPSQNISYGNINNTSLQDVLMNEEFKQLWKIKKDDIEVCKDCEFRYICTDCRIFINDKANLLSKPSKCTYDPYTAVWN